MASIYSRVRELINRGGAHSLAQKRVLREALRNALGEGTVPAGVEANAADFQATAALYEVDRYQKGDNIYTEILIDITGLTSSTDANDVIGKNAATTSAAIFQFDADVCGTLKGGFLEVLETPATGDTDIDLVISATGTTAEDNNVTTGTTLVNSGGLAAGDVYWFDTSGVAAKPYFYLTGVGVTGAVYTTGVIRVTLIGS